MQPLGRLALALLLAVSATMAATDAHTAGPVTAVSRARAARKARKRVRALIRKGGIAKLPSITSALAGREASTAGHLAMDVVGTPPVLVDIPGQAIKDLFWQPGVIDALAAGTATPEQCGQFFAGSQDGTSGGLGACHMAESVGYSFDGILRGDNSLCYMRRCPTPANVAAGGVTVVSGQLPNDDITRVFSVPHGSQSRVVKVAVTGDPGGSARTDRRRRHAATSI